MTATANLASEATTEADAESSMADPAAESGPFVLNLCSSTTPMALAQTELPELQRFTFFVSRRFEEGRERFRLHMGFFDTLAEAEEWLGLVRDIYPGAWAGEAPGKKLRARAVEAAATQARHAVGPQPKRPATPPGPPAAASAAARAPMPPVRQAARAPMVVPTVHPPKSEPVRPDTAPRAAAPAQVPAAAARSGSVAAARTGAPVLPRMGAAAAHSASVRAVRIPQAQSARPAPAGAHLARQSPASSRVPSPSATPPTSRARPGTAAPAARTPLFSNSNVKEVLAALDEPERAASRPSGNASARAPAPAPPPRSADEDTLSDTQVLRFLESRRDETAAAIEPVAGSVTAESSISLLKPDDTGTRRALRVAVTRNQPVSFAVQLLGSAQPVALDKVPPLAIFSAYTLYCVEGTREGRKWYGLRLGFFSDAISAKQVAYYVRSEFSAVAVVPVSAVERERATLDSQRLSGAAPVRRRRDRDDSEIKLIEDSGSRASDAPTVGAAPKASAAPAARAAPTPLATRGARKSAGKVGARERRTPQTLEETLEILGANELAIDSGARKINDSGVRHLRVEVQKNTPFSRLLERLSERMRKP